MHHISPLGGLAIFAAGLLAGAINAVVGSGSLVTFPTLVGLGLTPLVANVSNNIGIVFGSISGTIGYRKELTGQGGRIRSLGPWSLLGGVTGAVLLLAKPGSFHSVVPWLVLLAVGLVVVQPKLAERLRDRETDESEGGWLLRVGVFLTGVYGGYFGAAQGVILIGILAIGLGDRLQRSNALKNALSTIVNGVATIVFIIAAPVDWLAVVLIAFSSVIGAQIGSRYGRRLPDVALRAIIVVGGVAVAIKLLV